MARVPSPWRRASKGGAWYSRVGGRAVRLAPADATKTDAQGVLNKLLAADRADAAAVAGLFTRDVLNLFLGHVRGKVRRGELEPVTKEGYERYLLPARDALGHHPADAVRPHHVLDWLDGRPGWRQTSRFNAVTAVKRAFRWAKRVGHVDSLPLGELERPAPRRREKVLTPVQADLVLAAVRDGDPFRDVLVALRETGCRPGEVYGLTADRADPDAGTWAVLDKVRRSTGRAFRTVYLSAGAVALTRRLLARHPAGHLFRNTRGNPWTRNAVAIRMGRLARKLGLGPEAVVYSLRHEFITDCLERGVPAATVAELVGHKDLTMISRVYGHLVDRADHLREAARKARPG